MARRTNNPICAVMFGVEQEVFNIKLHDAIRNSFYSYCNETCRQHTTILDDQAALYQDDTITESMIASQEAHAVLLISILGLIVNFVVNHQLLH